MRGQDGNDGTDGISGRAEGAGVYIAAGTAQVRMGRNLLADNQAGYRKQELLVEPTRIVLAQNDVIYHDKGYVMDHAPDVGGRSIVSLGGNLVSVGIGIKLSW